MAADEFNLLTENCSGGAVLLKLSGYLDAHTYERLDQQIAKLIADGHYKLLVDLSAVSYISSAGAGVFIAALNDTQEHKGGVVLINPSTNVREVLDMLGFNQIFKIVDNQSAALKII